MVWLFKKKITLLPYAFKWKMETAIESWQYCHDDEAGHFFLWSWTRSFRLTYKHYKVPAYIHAGGSTGNFTERQYYSFYPQYSENHSNLSRHIFYPLSFSISINLDKTQSFETVFNFWYMVYTQSCANRSSYTLTKMDKAIICSYTLTKTEKVRGP